MLERSFMSHGSQHAAHARREFRVLYVEFDIYRKLATMTVVT
jgi:hypothetical protein